MEKLLIKQDGKVIDIKYGSKEALQLQAKRLKDFYKINGYNYKISIIK